MRRSGRLKWLVLAAAMQATAALGADSTDKNRELTDQQWQADLVQLSEAIKEIHFKPFTVVPEGAFDAAIAAVAASIHNRSDKEIIVSMAEAVALLKDGHTRLHIPRQYPEFALEAESGHSGTQAPSFERLKFRQLPVSFQWFEDGVFVTGATAEHSTLVGQQVVEVGGLPIEEALQRAKTVSFYENESRARLIATDRLALPEVLFALGVTDSPLSVWLTTRAPRAADELASRIRTELAPMQGEDPAFMRAKHDACPLWRMQTETDEWYEVLPSSKAIYVQVNRFAESPARPYSEFVAATLEAARQSGATRYVLDLRHNSGGVGAWTLPFITGLVPSEFNQYGRLFVLIGRTTFSAAQHLLHQLEAYTYAIFVGEDSGAKPSHFGDSRRVRLDNSGLTLRVSTLHWQSWLANDFREATSPHLDAPQYSTDYFLGRDAALDAALAYEPPQSPALQVGEQLRQGHLQNGLLLYQRYLTDANYGELRAAIPELIRIAEALLEEDYLKPGLFVLMLVNNSYPGNAEVLARMGGAYELLESPDNAADFYQQTLLIEPANQRAMEGLARMGHARPE